MKGFKKIVALGVAATMMMGSSLTAFAASTTQDLSSASAGALAGAEQTVEGAGSANYLFKKVFKVTVPTSAEANKVFAYYTDPQGLIVETEAAQIGAVEITDDTGVFFTNRDETGTAVAISSTSDPLTLVNKSTSAVEIGVKVKLAEETSGQYTSGYSTTADFTGTGDAAKGVYLGLSSTGNAVEALSATEATLTNYAKSAYPLFAVTWDTTNSTYKFDIPEANEGAEPVYQFVVNGALNKALADKTWYAETSGQPLTAGAALKMPKIELKYTPTYVDARPCLAAYGDDGVAMWNYDDTAFATGDAIATATVAAVKVNNAAVSSVTALEEDGTILIPYTDIMTALGIDPDEEGALDIMVERLQGVQATINGIVMYANIDA